MDLEIAIDMFNKANPYRKVIGYWEITNGFVLLSDLNGSVGTNLFRVTKDGVTPTTPMATHIEYSKMRFYG